jgi:hypothetical protein
MKPLVHPDKRYREKKEFGPGEKKMAFPRELIFQLYVAEGRSAREISELHFKTFRVRIGERQIAEYIRSWGFNRPRPIKRDGIKVAIREGQGPFCWIYRPTHPRAMSGGWLKYHWFVAEQKYGIKFSPRKHRLRFVDGDGTNCDPANIVVTNFNKSDKRGRDTAAIMSLLRGKFAVGGQKARNRLTAAKLRLSKCSNDNRVYVQNQVIRRLGKAYKRRKLNESEKLFLKWLTRKTGRWQLTNRIWYEIPLELRLWQGNGKSYSTNGKFPYETGRRSHNA